MGKRKTLNPDWAKKHPEKAQKIKKIHIEVYHHPELYPLKDKCELCPLGDEITENLQHAHYDYDDALNYITACPSCHNWMDKHKIERK